MLAKCEFESIWKLYDYNTISKSFYTNCAQSAASSSLWMKCYTFPLHKKGGNIMNEWLAHWCNPQLKSETVAGPEWGHATIN